VTSCGRAGKRRASRLEERVQSASAASAVHRRGLVILSKNLEGIWTPHIMDRNNILNNSWNIIKKAIIIDIIITILSIIIWFFWGRNGAISITDIVFILGGITTGCGSYFILGAKKGQIDYNYCQSRFVSQINYHDRLGQEIDYIDYSYYNATIFFIAGLVAIGASIIVYKVVG
jgi:hypothetical protein